MSDTIERLTGADYEEAMDTMGHAFGFEEGRDFPSLLPQIYRPTDEWMQAIYAIRRDGKIVSAVVQPLAPPATSAIRMPLLLVPPPPPPLPPLGH